MKQVRLFLALAQQLIIFLLCGTALILSGSYLYLSPNLPSTESLKEVKFQTPLKVYTEDKKLIAEFGEIRRIPLKFNATPNNLVNAILAAEDDQFFNHPGISVKALVRAAVDLVRTGSIKSGGSTITMQVAKNFFLTRERTFKRKFNEILLALQIESDLTKEEILELYINKIFLGHRAYGFGAAAQVYYGKDISQLDLAQWAMLASLPKAPSRTNPITNPHRAIERRNWILERMLNLGYINAEDYKVAINSGISAANHGSEQEINAPYVAEMARKEMLDRYGTAAYTNGYIVTTTIDSQLQTYANEAVQTGLMEYDQRHGYRGPARHINIDEYTPQDDLINAVNKISGTETIHPAIVFDVQEEIASALTKQGDVIYLDTESVKWARPYINVNRQGPAPEQINEAIKVGDIIYATPSERTKTVDGNLELGTEPTLLQLWNLSQIPNSQGALASLNPQNGAILALVGGYNFQLSHFNRATQADRQAGSNFKPFIYAAALHHGFTAATVINDAPVVFKDAKLEATWRPENSSGKFYGPTRLRQALYKSRNLVSIRLLRKLGIDNAIQYIKNFGFDAQQLPNDLSLALGSAAMTPLDIARGYAVIANGGYLVEPHLISKIETSDGELVFLARPATVCQSCEQADDNSQAGKQTPPQAEEAEEFELEELAGLKNLPASYDEVENLLQAESSEPTEAAAPQPLPLAPRVMDKQVNYLITNLMQDVIRKGTGRRALSLKRNDIAGKTGTTNDQNDAWFSGFNPEIVTTVWAGFDSPKTLGAREYGGTVALPIWIQFMQQALQNRPDIAIPQPDGLVTIRIDPETGEAAAPGQDNAIFEIFRQQYAPERNTQVEQTSENIEDAPPETVF